MNGPKPTHEINRARDEIARLAECLQPRRVRAFSRPRLLRVQADLAMLTLRLGEIQRIVSRYVIQRRPDAVVISEALPSPTRPPISLVSESTIAAEADPVIRVDPVPLTQIPQIHSVNGKADDTN